jgi:hypothetical protein
LSKFKVARQIRSSDVLAGLPYQEYDARTQRADAHNVVGKGDINTKCSQASQDQVDRQEDVAKSFIDFHFVFLSKVN